MSSEVGDLALEALTEKGPKRQKGPQSVCKGKLPKNSTMSVKRSIFKKIPGPLGPLPRDEIYGGQGDRCPGFCSPVRQDWGVDEEAVF